MLGSVPSLIGFEYQGFKVESAERVPGSEVRSTLINVKGSTPSGGRFDIPVFPRKGDTDFGPEALQSAVERLSMRLDSGLAPLMIPVGSISELVGREIHGYTVVSVDREPRGEGGDFSITAKALSRSGRRFQLSLVHIFGDPDKSPEALRHFVNGVVKDIARNHAEFVPPVESTSDLIGRDMEGYTITAVDRIADADTSKIRVTARYLNGKHFLVEAGLSKSPEDDPDSDRESATKLANQVNRTFALLTKHLKANNPEQLAVA